MDFPAKTGAAAIAQILSGGNVDESIRSDFDLLERIRSGLPHVALVNVANLLGLSVDALIQRLDLSPRTMARRHATTVVLNPVESESVVRAARLYQLTMQVLGSHDKAKMWLGRESRALGGRVPLSFLDTSYGTRLVEDVLGRLDHGVIG